MKTYFEHPKKRCTDCTPETAAISECAGRFSFLLVLLTLALSFLLLGISPVSAAKSYSIGDIYVRANILEDGSLRIEESRTYHFQGSFSWADYRLPLNRIGNVQNFSITENGQEYRRSYGEEPGTFYTREDGNEFYARWYYRARNESRTFTLRYLVADAVTAYDDIAEFYYQFIGADNAGRIGNVDISISLPRPATPDEVKIWAHGPLWGKIDFSGNDIRMSVSPLPARQFWEARVVFPKEWVPDAQKRVAGAQLNSIMAQEAAWARRANEQRKAAIEQLRRRKANEEKAWPVSLILSFFGFISFMVLYGKYGRSFPVPYNQKFDSALPEEKIPAVVSALYYNKQVNGNALASTLFDLARRGFLSIEQRMPAEKKWWRSDAPHFIMKINQKKYEEEQGELLDFEKSLIDFIFTDLEPENGEVDIKAFTRHSTMVRKWFQDWKKLLKPYYEDVKMWDRPSIRGMVISITISILVIAGGILVANYLGDPGLIAVFAGIICFGLSFTILRYTPDIREKRNKWEALRRYLKKYLFVNDMNTGWLSQIQIYLIYALAFGVGNKAIEKLLAQVPAEQQQTYFPWYYYAAGAHASPVEFAHAVSSMVSIASSSMSSASGAGGGASGGGGGGGGGASGGAG